MSACLLATSLLIILILHVYTVHVSSLPIQIRKVFKVYIYIPFLFLAWSCRWFVFSIRTFEHCLITSSQMGSTRTWLFVWIVHAKLDVSFVGELSSFLMLQFPFLGWPSPHWHAHKQNPEGAYGAARCRAWLEARGSTDGKSPSNMGTSRNWEIQQLWFRYSGNIYQQNSHLKYVAGMVVMWECE